MKYLSLDIETTGLLDFEHAKIWQIGAVAVDTEKEENYGIIGLFNSYIEYNEPLIWQEGALKINVDNIKRYYNRNSDETFISKLSCEDVIPELFNWAKNLFGEYKLLLAGKNVMAFDLPFIKKHCEEYKKTPCGFLKKISSRSLDPALFFIRKEDKYPPSLDQCIVRAVNEGYEFPNHHISHDGLSDALVVVHLFEHLKRKGLIFN